MRAFRLTVRRARHAKIGCSGGHCDGGERAGDAWHSERIGSERPAFPECTVGRAATKRSNPQPSQQSIAHASAGNSLAVRATTAHEKKGKESAFLQLADSLATSSHAEAIATGQKHAETKRNVFVHARSTRWLSRDRMGRRQAASEGGDLEEPLLPCIAPLMLQAANSHRSSLKGKKCRYPAGR